MPDNVPPHPDRGVQVWLALMAALVLAMVVVGGATRLTGSGLSITEWQPILGALPPQSSEAWAEAFEKYKQIPQYKLLNKGMSLDAFQTIYWWEWSHRLLGRLIGAAFVVPLAVFASRRRIDRRLIARLAVLFVLGGLQGLLGWYMVASGLVDRTEVSQYRLAAHLLLACLLFAALVWTELDVTARANPVRLATHSAWSRHTATLIALLVFLQIGAGALVAGLKAGLAYNTWPLMDGHLVPGGLLAVAPAWRNVFENAATVQFDHRMIAYVIAGLVVIQAVHLVRVADSEWLRRSALSLLGMVGVQIGLGVATLLSHVSLDLALAHQATALLVLAAAVWHRHGFTRFG